MNCQGRDGRFDRVTGHERPQRRSEGLEQRTIQKCHLRDHFERRKRHGCFLGRELGERVVISAVSDSSSTSLRVLLQYLFEQVNARMPLLAHPFSMYERAPVFQSQRRLRFPFNDLVQRLDGRESLVAGERAEMEEGL